MNQYLKELWTKDGLTTELVKELIEEICEIGPLKLDWSCGDEYEANIGDYRVRVDVQNMSLVIEQYVIYFCAGCVTEHQIWNDVFKSNLRINYSDCQYAKINQNHIKLIEKDPQKFIRMVLASDNFPKN